MHLGKNKNHPNFQILAIHPRIIKMSLNYKVLMLTVGDFQV